MSNNKLIRPRLRLGTALIFFTLSFLASTAKVEAQSEEFDSYKIKLDGFWMYSNPSGQLRGSIDNDKIDLVKDLEFGSYSTFAGKLDWKFTHKNHFYFLGVAFNSSKQTVLTRTITFQGQTFEAGATIQSSLTSPLYGFGYQYDIIRRRRGHIGLGLQVDVFDAHASIRAAAQTIGSGGVHQAAITASNSLVAPIPIAGPQGRFYLTNSPKLFVEGQFYGMYFFGYGDFISAAGDIGYSINKHLSINAGYQLGSRLVVTNNASSDRLGLRLTQRGPIVGMEISF